MVRGGKKESNAPATANPEAEERKRLKNLAFKNSMLSDRVGSSSTLSPSKTVLKHHGADILRKSQRKNRFLFSFPGLLGPVSGGKIGELKNLGTKNPILYLDFPQGQMKLFGTILYPKNRYLTLQFSRGGKNVMCEDYFDNMIVFSEAWWIGKKDENPEELRLEFPNELNMEQNAECDFKGGAGAISGENKGLISKSGTKRREPQSPKHELTDDDDSFDSVGPTNVIINEVTPIRQSARKTARKSYKFAEASSGDDDDDVMENISDASEGEEEKVDVKRQIFSHTSTKTENIDIDLDMDKEHDSKSEQVKQKAKSTPKSKSVSKTNQVSLVQSTISTLFKKVEDKTPKPKSTRKSVVSPEPGTSKRQTRKKSDSDSVDPDTSSLIEVDDIEDFSTSTQDADASDESWEA